MLWTVDGRGTVTREGMTLRTVYGRGTVAGGGR